MGEEADNYLPELRPLYFGLKNIILKELEFMDRDIDVAHFFDAESAPLPEATTRNSMVMKKKNGSLRKSMKNSQIIN
jgi:hypothetical protein